MAPTFDYIVVGGGTAGVVIASRLKQYLPDARIALLEAGPNAVDHPKVNDVTDSNAWLSLMQDGLVIDYSTTPQEHLDGRQVPNVAGRLLSGNSGVNVGNWMRPSITDCDIIAERAGNERFKFKNMVKYFKRLETHFDAGADKEYSGFDGPIFTSGGRKYPLRDTLQQTAEQLGHRYNPAATKGNSIGFSDFVQCFRATSDSTATRQHSAKVYNLSGVDVFCDSPAARILFDDTKRAIGVELVSGEKLCATKEVIVSCGAQRTPQLLMLSGIGPAQELQKHDIPIITDSPAVGQNYFDHSAFLSYYKLKDASKGYALPFTGSLRPEYTQGLPVDFSLFGHIPATELHPHLPSPSHPLTHDPRAHYLNYTFYLPLLAPPTIYPSLNPQGDNAHIALAAIHMLPLSRGCITLASSNPKDNPLCNPNFLATETDRFIFRRAVRENLKLVTTSPLKDEIECEIPPVDVAGGGDGVLPALSVHSSDEEIDKRIRAFCMTVAHPMGTCSLGTVLDSEFKVKGMQGVRVCDASVLPECGVMPSCLVYALGEMCAEIIVAAEGS